MIGAAQVEYSNNESIQREMAQVAARMIDAFTQGERQRVYELYDEYVELFQQLHDDSHQPGE